MHELRGFEKLVSAGLVGTTLVLSALFAASFGVLVWWLQRRHRRNKRKGSASRPVPRDKPSPRRRKR